VIPTGAIAHREVPDQAMKYAKIIAIDKRRSIIYGEVQRTPVAIGGTGSNALRALSELREEVCRIRARENRPVLMNI